MKIILAPDSFKGSLSAIEVCHAMEEGIRRVQPHTEIVHIPMADGGEGTVAALVSSTNGSLKTATVTGPLGESVEAVYGLLGNGQTAVIEMAAASGLPLVPVEERNPLYTTTYGTGELIRQAMDLGVKEILIGIGGSATTDCGTGMAQALGVRFLGENGLIHTAMTGDLMGAVTQMDVGSLDPRIQQIRITVACDVHNPLLGPEGAVAVYGPQKGAGPEDLSVLESNMNHIVDMIETVFGVSVRDLPGAGAAGGLGAGLVAFLNAELKSGIKLILDACGFSVQIKGADLIITGEGKVDSQTGFGKTISGVMVDANKQGIPGGLVAGSIGIDSQELKSLGIQVTESLCSSSVSTEYAMEHASDLIADRTESLLRKFITI